MNCWKCTPMCDNCKPKHLVCPECGCKNFLIGKRCLQCGLEFTDNMRTEARQQWRDRKMAEKAELEALAVREANEAEKTNSTKDKLEASADNSQCEFV